MAVVTLDILTADLADAQAALCDRAHLRPVNAANAKLALVRILKDLVKQYRRMVAESQVVATEPDIS